jgi:CRISPR/Cas system-associated exonuclease Cas4 (RecB family)
VERELVQNHLFYPTMAQLRHETLFTYAGDTLQLAQYLLEHIQQVGRYYEQEMTDTYNGLYQESIFRAYQTLNRLCGLVSTGCLPIEKQTFARLLRKLMTRIQIPFHGEPLKGLQIMGVLETRALDFKNILMLNVNEGFMPGSSGENSFIPHFLRAHFEMSTVEDQDSIYAYYFYRLMQRAEQITFVYNTDKTQLGQSEMSRFLLQLLVDQSMNKQIKRYSLSPGISPRQPQPMVIQKDPEILQILKERYDVGASEHPSILSPTALNTYIDCPYRFYLVYVRGLRSKETLSDELDNSVFGSIFHAAAERLYREIRENQAAGGQAFTVQAEDLKAYIDHPHRLRRLVLKAFEEKYFQGRAVSENDFNGEQILNFQVLTKMLGWLAAYDLRRTPFTILGLERRLSWEVGLERRSIRLRIGGIVDRLEQKDGKLHVIDYKTGGKAKEARSPEALFEQKNDRPAHIFQTFTYAEILSQQPETHEPVAPELIYIQQLANENYTSLIRFEKNFVEDFQSIGRSFGQLLLQTVDGIFDPEIPFTQTRVARTCQYCDFKDICGRTAY